MKSPRNRVLFARWGSLIRTERGTHDAQHPTRPTLS
jgi:hypothetical protein